MKFIYKAGLLSLMVMLFTSCKEDDTKQFVSYDGSVSGLIANEIADINLFYQAAVKVGLDSKFEDETQKHTVFAPTNAAMRVALTNRGFSNVDEANNGFLDSLIKDHIVLGNVLSFDLIETAISSKTTITTLSGKKIYVSLTNGIELNGRVTVSNADNEGENGVVHVVTYPLIDFPSQSIFSIIDSLADQDSLLIFNTALGATGLNATLDETTEYTVFAPTDDAFNDLGIDETNITSLYTTEELTEIVMNHIIEDRNFTQDLSNGRLYTLNGDEAQSFDISVSVDAISLPTGVAGTATSEYINVLATNGTIHVMDAVLVPRPYVFDAIDGTRGITDDDTDLFEDFYDELSTSPFDYKELLSSEENYTIMTFSEFFGGNSQEELDAYIFEGEVFMEDGLMSAITSIGGQRYFIADSAGTYFWNGGSITNTLCDDSPCVEDFQVYNGLITSVSSNETLTPLPKISTATVVLNATDTLDLFFKGLRFTELDSVANATYFAIANDTLAEVYREALEASEAVVNLKGEDVDIEGIPADDYDSLYSLIDQADIGILTDVFQRHIVNDLVFNIEMEPDVSITNQLGEILRLVDLEGNNYGFLVDDDGVLTTVNFERFDILGSNGIVHVLNDLLPDSN